MARRSRHQQSTPPVPAGAGAGARAGGGAAAAPAAPGARRFVVLGAVTFGLAGLLALVVPTTGASLLGLAAVLAAALGGACAGRALGLPRGVAAAPAAGVGFALVALVAALRDPHALPGVALPGLAAAALAALLIVDVVAAAPARLTARGAALGRALGRGPGLRLAATAALLVLGGRGVWLAALDAALALAVLALLAAALLWRAAGPAATLLATLLFGLVPAALALGLATDHGLWTPVTQPLAAALAAGPQRPGLLLGASGLATALCWALALQTAAAADGDAAG